MRVKVRTMRKLGHSLPQQERNALPPVVGVLNIEEHRDPSLGRSVVRAQLRHLVEGIEVLPDLVEARVLWLKDGQFRLAGIERVSDAEYAQTWAVEVA